MTLPHDKITPIPNNEPDAVPSLWNTRYAQIDENFEQLDERTGDLETEVQEARAEHPSLPARLNSIAEALGLMQDEFGNVAGASAVSVQRAVTLDWLYRNNRVVFELWGPGFTMIDYEGTNIIQGVSGDDSIDVASTAGLVPGQYYVLHDQTGDHLIRVQAILSEVRLRMTSNLPRNFNSGRLSRCSMSIVPSVRADAAVGDIWLSKQINVGDDAQPRAVVIRRTLNSGAARLYFQDSRNASWVERDWSTRRQGGDIPAGFADYEYSVPMRGDGFLRVDVAAEPMSIRHVVALHEPTGLGGFVNPAMRPTTPLISSPGNNATDIMERPTLAIAGYASPGDTSQAGLQFQISTVNTFASVRHDTGQLAAGLSYQVPAGVLTANTTYFVRSRVMDSSGLWSDWSATVSFKTAVSFTYVSAPIIVSPANNESDVAESPTIQTGAFTTVGGADTHAASRWQIRASSGTWANPVWDSGEDMTNKLSCTVPIGILQPGKSVYFVRVAHKGEARGWSEFSNEVKFTTMDAFALAYGVVLVTTGGNGGTWAYVDQDGNPTGQPSQSYFNSHPIWGGVQDVIIDGQDMVRIPRFYVKYEVLASGPYQGKPAWWVSDKALDDHFILHTAFRHLGATLDQIYIGKYQASRDGLGKLRSAGDTYPAVNRTLAEFMADADARNVNGVSGFMLWSVYHWSAVQWLYLVEHATTDSQTKTGQGRVSGASAGLVDAPDVAQATYRGMVGLWGNVSQRVVGVRVDPDKGIEIWDFRGDQTWIPTGKTYAASIYPTTFMDDFGEGYALTDVFLGATGPTTNVNATAPDAQNFSTTTLGYASVGGSSSNGTAAGLWSIFCNNSVDHKWATAGARLAKV